MITVNLTYFKQSGKYYASGEYSSNRRTIDEIWDEVILMRNTGDLPGLAPGCGSDFVISIDAPDAQHSHPNLIMPTGTY